MRLRSRDDFHRAGTEPSCKPAARTPPSGYIQGKVKVLATSPAHAAHAAHAALGQGEGEGAPR